MTWRRGMRTIAEHGLALSGIPALSRKRRCGETLILAYHNIVPTGERAVGDRSLHLSQRAFAAQLDHLAATHDVVGLEDAIRAPAPAGGSPRRPRAVITFDDAYRGAVSAGVAELAARRLPATIFVAPAFVGGGTFWWDALAPSEGGGLDPAVRARALDAWRGVDAEVRVRAAEIGVAASPLAEHARCATEGELAAAAASHPGLVYGSHTWGHPNLARLRQDELAAELARPLAWLRERFARVSLVLSYPYGLATTETERAAAAAGYRAAVRIDGGWMPLAPSNVFALPRLNVPAGVTSSGFLLRAAGVVGG